jgi:transposase
MEIPVLRRTKHYTQDDINKLVGYIVDDKMSIGAASKKANMNYHTGRKYHQKYLQNHLLDDPFQNDIAQERKSKLIGYIVDDKMSIRAAAKKANVTLTTGQKWYCQHLRDQKRDVSTRRL